MPSGLSVAVDDPAAREVVRRQLDLHPVAEEDLDAVTPHLPGGVAERLVSVVELDPEHSVAESLDDLALQLEFLFFLGDSRSLPLEINRSRGRRSGHDVSYALADRGVDRCDVDRLRPLGALALLELDSGTLGEALEASPAMLLWCTKRSFVPSSGAMKPYPLLSLNHLTVPLAI